MANEEEQMLQNILTNGDMHLAERLLEICRQKNLHNLSEVYGKIFEELFPSSPEIKAELAYVYLQLQKPVECVDYYTKVLSFKGLPPQAVGVMNVNRSAVLQFLKDLYTDYPREIVNTIVNRPKSKYEMLTFTITTCKRYQLFEKTMNSFLRCCKDVMKIDKWLCVDDNSSDVDRERMKLNYPFFEFYFKTPEEKGHARSMNIIKRKVSTPFILHMEDDWEFRIQENYITNALDVLTALSKAGQCLFNRNYAETENEADIAGGILNVTKSGCRFFIHEFSKTPEEMEKFKNRYGTCKQCTYWPHYSLRPSILKRSVWEELGDFNESASHFEMEYAYRYAEKYVSTMLESVYCVHIGRLTSERGDLTKLNAYDLNKEIQFGNAERVEMLGQCLNVNNIECYIVNLKHRQDRWNGIVQNKELSFLRPKRFEAVNGLKLLPTEQLQRIFDGNDYNMRAGMVGCAMSHIELCINLVNSTTANYYVILEDDITLVPDFQSKFNSVMGQLPEDWDMVYLGHHLWPQYRIREFIDRDTPPIVEKWTKKSSMTYSIGGTFGYCISKRGAVKLLEFINRTGMSNAIDTMQQRAIDFMNVYYVNPIIVNSECYTVNQNSDTDIQKNYTSLTIPPEERMKKYISKLEKIGVVLQTDDFGRVNDFITNPIAIDKQVAMIYTAREVVDILKLSKICNLPAINIANKYLVLVANCTDETKNSLPFERLKKNGVWNIQEALTFTAETPTFVSLGDLYYIYEGLKNTIPNQPELPFDSIHNSNLELTSLFIFNVLNSTESEVHEFVNDMCNPVINNTYIQQYNKKVVVKSTKYDVCFPHDDTENLVSQYLRKFQNFLRLVKSGEKAVFIYGNRGEISYDESVISTLVEEIRKRNGKAEFVFINGFTESCRKIEGCTFLQLPFEVASPGKKGGEMSDEAIRYDQDVYRHRVYDVVKKLVKDYSGI